MPVSHMKPLVRIIDKLGRVCMILFMRLCHIRLLISDSANEFNYGSTRKLEPWTG